LQRFFRDYLGKAVPEENPLDFIVPGEISEADTPTIQLSATPSGLISDPPPSSPYFYAGYCSCHKHPNLSWLGIGTKYAVLLTQWLG